MDDSENMNQNKMKVTIRPTFPVLRDEWQLFHGNLKLGNKSHFFGQVFFLRLTLVAKRAIENPTLLPALNLQLIF